MKNENASKGFDIFFIVVVDILKHFRSIILVTLIFAIGADVYATCTYKPMYQSEATFALKTNNQYATIDKIDETKEISDAFGYIISSNIFKQKIMEDLKVTSLDGYYTTIALENTNIIKISATSSMPKVAYQMMNSMLNRYQEISKLVLGEVNIELMQDISIPMNPINPLTHQTTLMKFGIVGMSLSIVVLALLSYFSSTVKLEEDIERLQLPLLGSICKESKLYRLNNKLKKKKSILITQMSTSFRYIETMKKIRYKIENKKCKTIMVTSSLENEGKTSLIANLAIALKDNHKKVLLIDGDLRKPAIHKIFELESNDAINQILKGNLNKDLIIHNQNGIDFLLGKTSYEDAAEKIESPYLKQYLDQIKDEYDYILFDSVPSALFSDAISLAKLCDGYILVIRQNYIVEKMIEDTVDKLSLSQTPMLGCILNQKLESPLHKTRFAGSYYGYRYGYGYHRKGKDGENHE